MDLLQKEVALYDRALKSELILVQVSGAGASKSVDLPHSNDGAGVITILNIAEEHNLLMIIDQAGAPVAFTVSSNDIVIADAEIADADKLALFLLRK